MSIGPELKRLCGQVSHLEHQLVQHKNNAERFKAERDDYKKKFHGLRDGTCVDVMRENRELEAERDELRNGRDVASDRVQELRSNVSRLIDDNEELEAERDELKDRLVAVTVNKRCENKWKTLCDWLRLDPEAPVSDVYDPATKPPRVITADELREGQCVAAQFQSDDWAAGVTTRNSSDELILAYSVPGSSCRSLVKNFKAFVLLADAPPQEPEPKRLTVEDLDAAEVGSKVTFTGSWLTKDDDGTWMGVKAEDIISMNPDRTLTPPESARRGRVVKPEELREDDIIDLHWTRGGCNLDRYVSRAEGTLIYLQRDNPDALEEAVSSADIAEIRLISRKPPEPSEHPVILVHKLTHCRPQTGPAFWDGKYYHMAQVGGFDAESILDWSPARVVPAGQEVVSDEQ